MGTSEPVKKILNVFRLSNKLDENSTLFTNPLISAELTLNSEIFDVKKMRITELAPQLLITSKNLWPKNLAILVEIKLDNQNTAKMLIVNDKIIGIQLGSVIGNKALETIDTFKADIIDVAIMTIDVNKVSSSLSSVISEELKSEPIDLKTITKETISTSNVTEQAEELKKPQQVPTIVQAQDIQQAKTTDITDLLRPIYDDIYLLVRKYTLNLVSAPEVKLENNEIHIQIRISPISGLFASRTKKKFVNELRDLVQSKKGSTVKISLEEVIEAK